jgi:hypothetical protein
VTIRYDNEEIYLDDEDEDDEEYYEYDQND